MKNKNSYELINKKNLQISFVFCIFVLLEYTKILTGAQ